MTWQAWLLWFAFGGAMMWLMWKFPLSDDEAKQYIERMRPKPPFRGSRY